MALSSGKVQVKVYTACFPNLVTEVIISK